MSLSNKPDSKAERPAEEVQKKLPKFSIVKERGRLARQVEEITKDPAKEALKNLKTEVAENKIDPSKTLKAAVVQKFNDTKKAHGLLEQTTSHEAAIKLMAEIDDRFGAQLARFSIPSDEIV